MDKKQMDQVISGIANRAGQKASFGKRMADAKAAKGQNTSPPTAPVRPQKKGPLTVKNAPMKPIRGKPLAGPVGGQSPQMQPSPKGGGVHIHVHLPSDSDADDGY